MRWRVVPYPILLVIGGLALSLLPSLPTLELPPDLVLMIFLLPLLYSAAFSSCSKDAAS
jgi:CPA1 family monovalent cation:H+ antiporter